MKALRMYDDSLEVLHADYDMHIFKHMKIVELVCMQSDYGLKWLLEHLWRSSA